jgi:hypothetical protein
MTTTLVSGVVLDSTTVTNASTAAAESTEIAHHFHSRERWLGLMASPADGKVCDSLFNPFVITSSASSYGTAVKIIDVNDTPQITAHTKWDIHRLFVVDSTSVKLWRLRISWGPVDAATAVGLGNYTETLVQSNDTNTDRQAIDIQMPRVAAGQMAWIEGNALDNTKTIKLMIGMHEYTV